MSEPQKPSFMRNAITVAWALFTLILLFSVVLLANELMKSGKNPIDLTEAVEGPVISISPNVDPQDLRDVFIYVANADARMLIAERRSIPIGDFTVENCRAALDEMRRASPGGNSIPVLPPSADVAALYMIDDGQLVIDFTPRLSAEAAKSASAEALMVYGIVNTLTQDALKGAKDVRVKSVRFLVAGAAPTESFPAHLDLSKPVFPDASWILKVEAAQPSNG